MPRLSYIVTLVSSLSAAVASAPSFPGPDPENLPGKTVFPGLWEEYIQAPKAKDKAHIVPNKVWKTDGNVSGTEWVISNGQARLWENQGELEKLRKEKKVKSMMLGDGGMATFVFAQNIAGRVCFEVEDYRNSPFVALSYSESPFFADRETDATGGRDRDLNLLFPVEKNGTNCLGAQYVRGGFKYLTIHIPADRSEVNGFWHDGNIPLRDSDRLLDVYGDPIQWPIGNIGQHVLKESKKLGQPSVNISDVWIVCTAFPSNPNPQAYTGYFDSSSTTLNRIWYAGVYTLQLSTIDPKEGSAIIEFNRHWDNNQSPFGSWYSNFTISNGTSVTTDGAKRDRMVWPGDMFIATPGIAVSTYDMLSIRNALDTLFDHQYGSGGLPYAGPPLSKNEEFSDTYHLHTLLGVYIYVLYSGDLNWLEMVWDKYLFALSYELAKVDETGLLHVTSNADWLRPGMTGHNLEASAIMHEVLLKSIELAHFIGDDRPEGQPQGLWASKAAGIEKGAEQVWCARAGFFADNLGRRNCGGVEEVLAQDGNSWALITSILPHDDPRTVNISLNLRSRWGKYGAPAVEFPNVISPFATSFELLGHCKAGNYDAAVELMLLQWSYMLDGPGMTNSTFCEGYLVDGDVYYPAYPQRSRNSHSHGWSSGPTMTLLTEVLGIHLDSPLGRTWHVTPTLTQWLSYSQGGFATKLGSFEVKIKRMVDTQGRKAQVLDVLTPKGTSGRIEWNGAVVNVIGGINRYAVLESTGEILDLTAASWIGLTHEEFNNRNENWPKLSVDAGAWGRLTFDEDWKEPVMDEREAGVVDMELLRAKMGKAPWGRNARR